MAVYDKLSEYPILFQTLTGLRDDQFTVLYRALGLYLTVQTNFPTESIKTLAYPHKLDLQNRLLMTLMWIKVLPTYDLLGFIFGVHRNTVRRNVLPVVDVLRLLPAHHLPMLSERQPRRNTARFVKEFPQAAALFELPGSQPELRPPPLATSLMEPKLLRQGASDVPVLVAKSSSISPVPPVVPREHRSTSKASFRPRFDAVGYLTMLWRNVTFTPDSLLDTWTRQQVEQAKRRLNPARQWLGTAQGAALNYLALLLLAEVITILLAPGIGLLMQSMLLILLLIHASLLWKHPVHKLLLGLTFVPMTRLVSLAVPLSSFTLTQSFLITGLPLLIAALIAIPNMGIKRADIGLQLGRFPLLQFLVVGVGLLAGYLQYQLLQPAQIVLALQPMYVAIPTLVMMVCVGFVDEIIFRGILQYTACESLGHLGVLYTAVLYTALHLGLFNPPAMLLVFVVSLLFGEIAYRTKSLWGVILSHGLFNVFLYIVLPVLMG
jgi:hypothetical protein